VKNPVEVSENLNQTAETDKTALTVIFQNVQLRKIPRKYLKALT